MTTPNKYPAKVLLLGEHTILRGSRALAMPLWTHYSSWEWGRPGEATDLLALADYLDRDLPAQFATDRFRADLRAGLFLSPVFRSGTGSGVRVPSVWPSSRGTPRQRATSSWMFSAPRPFLQRWKAISMAPAPAPIR